MVAPLVSKVVEQVAEVVADQVIVEGVEEAAILERVAVSTPSVKLSTLQDELLVDSEAVTKLEGGQATGLVARLAAEQVG